MGRRMCEGKFETKREVTVFIKDAQANPTATITQLRSRIAQFRKIHLDDLDRDDFVAIVNAFADTIERDLREMDRSVVPDVEAALRAIPGMADREIARRFNCSATTVGKTRHRIGLVTPTRAVRRGDQLYQMRQSPVRPQN